jgi:hypothetical protein
LPETLNNAGVERGAGPDHGERPGRRIKRPGRGDVVLEQHGDAMQRREHAGPSEPVGGGARAVWVELNDGMDGGIDERDVEQV